MKKNKEFLKLAHKIAIRDKELFDELHRSEPRMVKKRSDRKAYK